ncbi:nose resistant to fluoxetine protein 6-like [Brevipalpus obovatus]|uniref:nose resistant to fluoxetine protein 6-like n=1 Tax=Brevipalpus obovatus TaxID=246614 RepID=UPI003D9F1ACA
MNFSSTLGTYVLCLAFAASSSNVLATIVVNEPRIAQSWAKSAATLDKLLWPQSEPLLNLIDNLTTSQSVPISQTCRSSLRVIAAGIRGRRIWALKFIESSAGTKPGFLQGYISDLGNYRECVSISHQAANSPEFKGQYCLVQIHFPLPSKPPNSKFEDIQLNLEGTQLKDTYFNIYAKEINFFYNNTFSFGFCIPSACTPKDLDTVTQKLLHGSGLRSEITSCVKFEPSEFPRLPRYQQTAFTLLSILVLMVLCSTLITHYYGGNVSPYIAAFSAIENGKKLIEDSKDGSNHGLQYMHGLRFMMRAFGLLGHIFLTLGILPHTFPIFSYTLPKNWLAHEMFRNMFIFIEIFFLMSGFLVVYSWYPTMKTGAKVSFTQYALVRYFRSTPLFIGILLLIFVFSSIGSGPIFLKLSDLVVGNCLKRWWMNIFYLSNWVRPYEMCYVNWWTVSIDFQLYCLSYLPMKWLVTQPKRGVYSLLILISLGPLITALVTLIKKTPLLTCCSLDYDHEEMFAEHFRTYTHSAPYYLGMLVGYLVVSRKRIENRLFLTFGHTLSTACWIGTFVGAQYYVDNHPDKWEEIFFISIQKVLFSIAYAWIFYVFSLGKGGVMQKNMGSKIFVPFSRLTFSISMSEMLFIWYDLTNSHQYFPIDGYNMTMRIIYLFIGCSLLGCLVYLLFEAPSLNLIKLLLKQKKKADIEMEKKANLDQKVTDEHEKKVA